MEIRIGPPATGDNFYPRPKLLALIHRRLNSGHLAFLGPRRTGKTSCLREISAHPPESFEPILLDLEKFDSAAAWLCAMAKGIREALDRPQSNLARFREKAVEWISRCEKFHFPGGIEMTLRDNSKTHPWRNAGDEMQSLLRESNAPLLFLLDGFPVFLNQVARKSSRDEVESVLNWFRSVRQELCESPTRFLVTGSIGLPGVVRRLGLSPSINDFDTLEIPPLTETEALEFLARLCDDNEVSLSLQHRRHVLKLLGANWPFLLQVFMSELLVRWPGKGLTKADLKRVYEQELVVGRRNPYCKAMFTRLKDVFTETECRLAGEILREVCRSEQGLSRVDFEVIQARLLPGETHRSLVGEELENVLETLKHDGYLSQDAKGEHRTRFGSNILRDFWRHKTS